MKNATDGRDLMFAGAGILWGLVTVYRGVQQWREEARRLRATSSCAVHAFPLTKMESPTSVLTGAAVSLGCLGYLVWTVCL